MPLPVTPARRALFDPSFVTFHDTPAVITVVETDPGGAATVAFDVEGPSISIKGKAGTSLYWLRNQRCADGAIILWCGEAGHAQLVELKQTVTAKSWNRAKDQFAGMLANAQSVMGLALLAPPATVTCHVAYTEDHLAASPVLSKTINTVAGPRTLAGAQWASGKIDLPEWTDVPVNKIVWGGAPTILSCP